MVTDWKNHTLAFAHNKNLITLKGVLAPSEATARELSVEQLIKWYKGNEIWAIAVVKPDAEHTESPIPECVQTVLDSYTNVFATPTDLPPEMQYDHPISLKPDVPFNARPYRYSPTHKDEIEKQVKQMLATGITVPSMSPYASPVLLVQKKDGSWRFCVDYRRLNELTIKNMFPMPVIDEPLDELSRASIFSKLDLRAGYHQIRMMPADEHKTAFKTHQGHFTLPIPCHVVWYVQRTGNITMCDESGTQSLPPLLSACLYGRHIGLQSVRGHTRSTSDRGAGTTALEQVVCQSKQMLICVQQS